MPPVLISLRLKKHSCAISNNISSLRNNQSTQEAVSWIIDYWLQRKCPSTLMETINRVVNCCGRGMKGRKLHLVKEKWNKGHVVPSAQESGDEPGAV